MTDGSGKLPCINGDKAGLGGELDGAHRHCEKLLMKAKIERTRRITIFDYLKERNAGKRGGSRSMSEMS